MKRLIRWLLPAAVFCCCGWWLARACGPNFTVAVFSYQRHPDLPRTEFINGRLGVLQPTFARSYLVIAWRYLNGIGLSPGEREQARDYYKDRFGDLPSKSWDPVGTDWESQWEKVRRSAVSPPAPRVSELTRGQMAYDAQNRQFALNCAEDAYRTAVLTFTARRGRFGSASPAFRSWLSAQDAVFANCDKQKTVIPPDATPDLPPQIRSDRQYQIAAAHFYAGQYEPALRGFRDIAADTSSQWSGISNYLIARTLFRMGDQDRLREQAARILARADLKAFQGMTWNLIGRAGIQGRNEDYFNALGRLLSSKGQENGLREELWNYTSLYDLLGSSSAGHFRDVGMTDWISTFQAGDPASAAHAVAEWKRTRSAAWLIAALARAAAGDPAVPGLLDAATAIPADSPAHLTAAFHHYRLETASGDKEKVREGLGHEFDSQSMRNLPSSENLFRGLRMMAAPNFTEFLTFALRRPVLMTLDNDPGELPDPEYIPKFSRKEDRLDVDSTRILNRETPFALLREAALGNLFSGELREQFLLTAFTRGLMLDEDITEIAAQLAQATPRLADFVRQYQSAQAEEAKRFAAAFLLLHAPEARPYLASGVARQILPGKIDEYRDNWWCPMDIPAELNTRAAGFIRWSPPTTKPGFLEEGAAEAAGEFDKLAHLGNATDYLGGIVLAYARRHRSDPRVPEALYRIVRAGHLGCSDVNTWKTSREAFRRLHIDFPKSPWAARTPLWFKETDIRQDLKWLLQDASGAGR